MHQGKIIAIKDSEYIDILSQKAFFCIRKKHSIPEEQF